MYKRERSRGDKSTFGRAGISRGRFLRLIGSGAGLSLLSLSSTMLGARPGVAQTSPAKLSDTEFPVGIWWPPPPDQTTSARYREIAAAGFTFVIGGNGVANNRANTKALTAAAAADLRLVLTDTELQRLISGEGTFSSASEEPEAPSVMRHLVEEAEPETFSGSMSTAGTLKDQIRERIQELRQKFEGHPALAGINLYDEPHKRLFERLSFASKGVLNRFGDEVLPYVDVWPSYASPKNAFGTKTYADYLRAYRDQVDPLCLCFNHYPLLSKGITADYYYNWAVIRKFAMQAPAIPSWGIIQSVGFDGRNIGLARRRTPTEAELFWQVNVGLAHGAKGIIYFTYWTPGSSSAIKFSPALIGRNGQRTPRYDYARRVNRYLSVIGRVLKPLVSESVTHAGVRRLPRGATAFKPDRYVKEVNGSPAIISRFRGRGGNERHLLVVNRSFAKGAKVRLRLSSVVTNVVEINRTTGEPGPALSRKLALGMKAGEARLFRLRTS